jgi:hypothetical protein
VNELKEFLTRPEDALRRPNGRHTLARMLEGRVLRLQPIERNNENQSYYDRLQRSYSWLWKAYNVEDESDLEARFLFAWVAFNALYGVNRDWLKRLQPKRDPKEQATLGVTDLKWFLWKIANADSGEDRIVDLLRRNLPDVEIVVKDPFLQEAYWEWNDKKADQRKHKDHAAITKSLGPKTLYECLRILFVWRLRTLRNLLMHGSSTNRYSKRRETEEGERSLAAAVRLTEICVGGFLAVMEDDTPHKWHPTEAPRFGSPLHGPVKETSQLMAEEWKWFLRVTSPPEPRRTPLRT